MVPNPLEELDSVGPELIKKNVGNGGNGACVKLNIIVKPAEEALRGLFVLPLAPRLRRRRRVREALALLPLDRGSGSGLELILLIKSKLSDELLVVKERVGLEGLK